MKLDVLYKLINTKLAGEQLSGAYLLPLMDEVIDDINNQLNSIFPTFSEFLADSENVTEQDYTFFPAQYLRTVVVYGAATKFYSVDEEGISPAMEFSANYNKYLYMMLRDYAERVPEEFQAQSQGYLAPDPKYDRGIWLV